jgi:hypothetical protein
MLTENYGSYSLFFSRENIIIALKLQCIAQGSYIKEAINFINWLVYHKEQEYKRKKANTGSNLLIQLETFIMNLVSLKHTETSSFS